MLQWTIRWLLSGLEWSIVQLIQWGLLSPSSLKHMNLAIKRKIGGVSSWLCNMIFSIKVWICHSRSSYNRKAMRTNILMLIYKLRFFLFSFLFVALILLFLLKNEQGTLFMLCNRQSQNHPFPWYLWIQS